jgi:hypothetical protein
MASFDLLLFVMALLLISFSLAFHRTLAFYNKKPSRVSTLRSFLSNFAIQSGEPHSQLGVELGFKA